MNTTLRDEPTFESFKCLLLDLARERSVDSVLEIIVSRLAALPNIALARIWLVNPGDICESCHFRAECPDQTSCLHLVASAGQPLDSSEDWSRTDGFFRRFPLGVRKVGEIAKTGDSIELTILDPDQEWVSRPEWARKEQIRGLIGHPLDFQGEVVGVLVVFLRQPPSNEAVIWLRIVADHAASALANARAFERIEHLSAQLELENEYLRDEIQQEHPFEEVIGESPALKKVLQQVELVAATDTNVLILGESGVGKELVARAIHDHSPRRDHPMIKVNCASVPRELFESEFFGHVKGSFTGAVRDRAGRFELADGGTLFLDEVGEIPLEMQSKLLRVLQEGSYEPIGDERTRHVDVRVVAATNRDLESEVKAKRFREDLYYRLSVFPIEVIPLRERKEDIPLLVAKFLSAHSRKLGITTPKLKRRHLAELENYDWPGNIRELQNVVERALIGARSGALRFELPDTRASGSSTTKLSAPSQHGERELLTYDELKQFERDNVLAVLEHVDWKISGNGGAADLLGVHPATLTSRMKAMGIKRPG